MAQNIGPILEIVTEKYLLREEEEWRSRHRSIEILDELLLAFRSSDVRTIAKLVTENFFGSIRSVIPWATNSYTETLIERVQAHFGDGLWGFWMLVSYICHCMSLLCLAFVQCSIRNVIEFQNSQGRNERWWHGFSLRPRY